MSGTPATNRRFQRRISVLLKKSVMPRIVKAAPDPRNIMPSLRLPDVRVVGSFAFDLRRCHMMRVMRYDHTIVHNGGNFVGLTQYHSVVYK